MRLEPFSGAAAVTKSDATVFPTTRGLYIGGAGDVAVKMDDTDTTVTFSAVPVGTFLPIAVNQVLAATTASLILALY